MIMEIPQIALWFNLRCALIVQGDLAPTTVQACNAVVGFDAFPALGAFGRTVSFDPVVHHTVGHLLRFHIRGDAVGWCACGAPFVHGVFAECTAETLFAEAN